MSKPLSALIDELLKTDVPRAIELRGGLQVTYHPTTKRLQIARLNRYPSAIEIRTFIANAGAAGVVLHQPDQVILPGLASGRIWHICRWTLESIPL